MKTLNSRTQRGQAMTEFVIALVVLLPLFFGIIYMGKFADIKHQAIQASRFTAFERALSSNQETDAVIEEEARQRFFTNNAQNDGKIGYQDSTTGLDTATSLNANWNTATAVPLITNYAGIQVDIPSSSNLTDGFFAAVELAGNVFSHLNQDGNTTRNGQVQGNVTVPIADILHLPAPLDALNLTVAATTVVAGDAWNGDGAKDVASRQNVITDPGKGLQTLTSIIDPLLSVFVDNAPTYGCVKADVVPDRSTNGATYKSSDPCQ